MLYLMQSYVALSLQIALKAQRRRIRAGILLIRHWLLKINCVNHPLHENTVHIGLLMVRSSLSVTHV